MAPAIPVAGWELGACLGLNLVLLQDLQGLRTGSFPHLSNTYTGHSFSLYPEGEQGNAASSTHTIILFQVSILYPRLGHAAME